MLYDALGSILTGITNEFRTQNGITSYKFIIIVAHLIEVDWADCKKPAHSIIIELHLNYKQPHLG